MHQLVRLGLVTATVTMTMIAGPATAQDAAARLAAATGEAQLVIYSSQNMPFMEGLSNAFEAQVPGIDVQVLRAPSAEILARLLAEQEASRPVADLYMAWWDTTSEVVKRGYAATYVPAGIEALPDVRDPDGKWAAVAAYASVIGYNSNNVAPADVPKSFSDLLDPKWKGRVGLVDPRIGGGPYGYYYHIWQLYGREYFEALNANEPFILRQAAAMVNAVGAGQVDVSIAGAANWIEAARSGAPVALVYPEDGVSLTYFISVVLENAPHPNAARVFLDWLVSAEGQTAVSSVQNAIYPLRPGISAPEGYPPLSDLQVVPTDFEEFLNAQQEIMSGISAALELGAN